MEATNHDLHQTAVSKARPKRPPTSIYDASARWRQRPDAVAFVYAPYEGAAVTWFRYPQWDAQRSKDLFAVVAKHRCPIRVKWLDVIWMIECGAHGVGMVAVLEGRLKGHIRFLRRIVEKGDAVMQVAFDMQRTLGRPNPTW